MQSRIYFIAVQYDTKLTRACIKTQVIVCVIDCITLRQWFGSPDVLSNLPFDSINNASGRHIERTVKGIHSLILEKISEKLWLTIEY